MFLFPLLLTATIQRWFLCPEGWTLADNKYCLLYERPASWSKARSFCQRRGAHLLTLDAQMSTSTWAAIAKATQGEPVWTSAKIRTKRLVWEDNHPHFVAPEGNGYGAFVESVSSQSRVWKWSPGHPIRGGCAIVWRGLSPELKLVDCEDVHQILCIKHAYAPELQQNYPGCPADWYGHDELHKCVYVKHDEGTGLCDFMDSRRTIINERRPEYHVEKALIFNLLQKFNYTIQVPLPNTTPITPASPTHDTSLALRVRRGATAMTNCTSFYVKANSQIMPVPCRIGLNFVCEMPIQNSDVDSGSGVDPGSAPTTCPHTWFTVPDLRKCIYISPSQAMINFNQAMQQCQNYLSGPDGPITATVFQAISIVDIRIIQQRLLEAGRLINRQVWVSMLTSSGVSSVFETTGPTTARTTSATMMTKPTMTKATSTISTRPTDATRTTNAPRTTAMTGASTTRSTATTRSLDRTLIPSYQCHAVGVHRLLSIPCRALALVVCESPLYAHISDIACLSGWLRTSDIKKCFYVTNITEHFGAALQYCSSLGSSLLTASSKSKLDIIQQGIMELKLSSESLVWVNTTSEIAFMFIHDQGFPITTTSTTTTTTQPQVNYKCVRFINKSVFVPVPCDGHAVSFCERRRYVSVPQFSLWEYRVKVPENQVLAEMVRVKTADSPYTIVYSVIAGDDTLPKFSINNRTGVISAIKLDREHQDSYTLTVYASFVGSQSGGATCQVHVSVLDVNDNVPVFAQSVYEARIFENAGEGTQVLRVKASDADLGRYASVNYSIGIEAKRVFMINAGTGVIRIIRPLDREIEPVYRFMVKAIDYDSKSAAIASVVVTVLDVNDNQPTFRNTIKYINLSERTPSKTKILSMDAVDRDDDGNMTDIVYSIVSDYPQFKINAKTGMISTATTISSLRLQSTRGHSPVLKVIATDGYLLTSATVTIRVILGNSALKFMTKMSMYHAYLDENVVVGNMASQVAAKYNRIDNERLIEYDIVNGNEDRMFGIDKKTGKIIVNKALDYEYKKQFQLTVEATDTGFYAYAMVRIHVKDANDNAPEFITPCYPVTVSVGTRPPAVITKITATDKDSGINGKIQYRLSGNDSSHFTIDEHVGIVQALITLETPHVYKVLVFASDNGSPQLFSVCSLVIRVAETDIQRNSREMFVNAYDLTRTVQKMNCDVTDRNENVPAFLTKDSLPINNSYHSSNIGILQGCYSCEVWDPFTVKLRMPAQSTCIYLNDHLTYHGKIVLTLFASSRDIKLFNMLRQVSGRFRDLPRYMDALVLGHVNEFVIDGKTISRENVDISITHLSNFGNIGMLVSFNIYVNVRGDVTPELDAYFYQQLTNTIHHESKTLSSRVREEYEQMRPIVPVQGSVRIHSTAHCFAQQIESPYGVYHVTTAPIGSSSDSIEKCHLQNGNIVPQARAFCNASFTTGASWVLEYSIACSVLSVETSDALDYYSEVTVTTENAPDISEQVANLTSDVQDLSATDVNSVSNTLKNIADVDGIDIVTADDFINTVSNIMDVDDTLLSQATNNAPASVIESLDRYTQNVDLGNKTEYKHDTKNLVVRLFDIHTSSSNRLALVTGIQLLTTNQASDHGGKAWSENINLIKQGSEVAGYGNIEVSLELPLELFASSTGSNQTRLSFTIQNDISLYESRKAIGSPAEDNFKLNSRVVSASLGKEKIENLSENIRIIFHPILNISKEAKVRCVYWDFLMNDGSWSSKGCHLVEVIDGRYVCECNHLTNFAVLMDLTGTAHGSQGLRLITLIGLSLSIIGLLLTILSFILFKKIRKGRPQRTLLNLAIALLCTYIVFLAGIDKTENDAGCIAVAVLLHYFLLVAFMWMLMEALLQYLRIVKVIGCYVENFTVKTCLAAWGIPLIPVIILLSVNHQLYRGRETYCWMDLFTSYFAFILPVGLILLMNFIIFALVIWTITHRNPALKTNQSDNKVAMINLGAAIACALLLGLTWVFGFLAVDIASDVFRYIFTILNTLHGFFIFLFFTLREKKVRDCWRDCLCPKRMKDKKMNKYTTKSSSATEPTSANNTRKASSTTILSVSNDIYMNTNTDENTDTYGSSVTYENSNSNDFEMEEEVYETIPEPETEYAEYDNEGFVTANHYTKLGQLVIFNDDTSAAYQVRNARL